MRVYTLAHDHPAIGQKCAACYSPFAAGDRTTLVALGPGNDPEQQQRAAEGRAYNAVAVHLHAACAGLVAP